MTNKQCIARKPKGHPGLPGRPFHCRPSPLVVDQDTSRQAKRTSTEATIQVVATVGRGE
jgi:hypothetical protein